MHQYTSHWCRGEMYDRDIILMQVCAAIMNPNVYLTRIIHRFGLSSWAEIGFEDAKIPEFMAGCPALSNIDDLSKILVLFAEEMFHLLIIILGERYQTGIGNYTSENKLEREIVHILCAGPTPFSYIESVI